MDIYEYFNSRDVAEHCKTLGRSFTGREMAYLIWQSNRHTLHHKIAAWIELIQTIPDEEHKDFEEAGCCGLHEFLWKYIDRLTTFGFRPYLQPRWQFWQWIVSGRSRKRSQYLVRL